MTEQAAHEEQTTDDASKVLADTMYGDEKHTDADMTESTEDKTSEEDQGEEKSETDTKEEVDTKEEESKEAQDEEEKAIEYKLELGEESHLDKDSIASITEFAKENNLSNEVAQTMLNKQDEAISDFIQSQHVEQDKIIDGWRESVITDKVLGGENLKETTEGARRVVERFGSEEFITLLRDTGQGDHPEVVRFLSNIGKLMSDDSLIMGNPGGESVSIEDLFYKNDNTN